MDSLVPLIDVPVEDRPIVSTMPREVAQHVVFWFGDENLGVQPGGFVSTLLKLVAKADTENRDLLATVYPEYVAAWRAVSTQHWGLEWLRKVARGDGS